MTAEETISVIVALDGLSHDEKMARILPLINEAKRTAQREALGLALALAVGIESGTYTATKTVAEAIQALRDTF